MKTVSVKKRELNLDDYVKRSAVTNDYSELITDPCVIKDENGEIICVYGIFKPEVTATLRQAVINIRIAKNRRTTGLRTQSRIFGFTPREPIRKNYCSSTLLAREQPREHAIVCHFAVTLAEYYQTYAPEIYKKHLELTDQKVLEEWKIKGSPFTSGIINKNNQLKYHFDAGNFRHVYSNMIAFKHDIEGGYLSIPEYDIALEIADNSVTFFDGQSILHGVTPFSYTSPEAYRYSIVYYSLQQMWKCEPLTKEIVRIRQRRTKLEEERFLRMTGKLENDPWAEKKLEIQMQKDEEAAEEIVRNKTR